MNDNTFSMAWSAFKTAAKMTGYTKKVINDDAFAKKRTPNSPTLRLFDVKNKTLKMIEKNKGKCKYLMIGY
jgi:hypothetical protein